MNEMLGQEDNQLEDPDQDVWSDLIKEYNDEDSFGTEVAPPLASMAKLMWSKKLTNEKLKGRLEKVQIPTNFRFLSVKSCNKPIWAKADSKRSNDLVLQKLQTTVSKSQVHILQLADQIIKAPKQGNLIVIEPSILLNLAKDALCLIGNANQQLNQYRRVGLIGAMPHLKGLAKDVSEEDLLLFGDDLDKRIQSLQDEEKTSKVLSRPSTPYSKNNFKKYKQPSSSYSSSAKEKTMVGKDLVVADLELAVRRYQACNTHKFLEVWRTITSNQYILDIIEHGVKIEFISVPVSSYHPVKFSQKDCITISKEIQQLLQKKAIQQVQATNNCFLSGIFIVPKKDGSSRMIINLKQLNRSVRYRHFKMETLQDVLCLIKPGVWMGSIDLKDAYHSIPFHIDFQKFLAFSWDGQFYQFLALPFGFGPAVRIFTKVLKAPFKVLRGAGHVSVVYIDDSYLQGDTYESCQRNIMATVSLLSSLGFTVHPNKSILVPTQCMVFLGFVLNSAQMTIALSEERVIKLKCLCKDLLYMHHPTVRFVSRVIGTLVSAFDAVKYGKLHYRSLETDKNLALKLGHGNFDSKVFISEFSIKDLQWWLTMAQFTRPIQLPKIDLILSSDASLQGWGGTDGNSQIGGRWSEGELPEHINTLELLAAFFTLKAFLKIRHFRHVQLRLDNTTAVAYITKMGGLHSIACNKLAVEIWEFARTCDVWLSACHIPGVLNTIADYKSRQFQDNIEWSLNVKQFNIISNIFWKFDIDLFASRLNAKCEDYFSLRPDPDAKAVNAFAQTWSNLNFYAFPPFNLIGKVLAKINIDQATGILVVPFWSSQPWFPQAINMLYRTPVLFPPSSRLLFLPGTKRQHPLHQTLSLLMLPVSGNRYKVKSFHQTLSISLQHHGEKVPRNNTRVQSDDGYNIALGGRLIPIIQM
ncbi:uncharacterized protein LOC130657847 [Hydractinia symbiolongicarpus]|uniref:uncharacterized protein LOC130657847 n=1 Tax=Hydractinia symbiolongicarpus TaxID=13093 RepID=UPI002549F69C|nr:uncharacterized protein LOC130657847 [Hydractinia symbiolongicarpus]